MWDSSCGFPNFNYLHCTEVRESTENPTRMAGLASLRRLADYEGVLGDVARCQGRRGQCFHGRVSEETFWLYYLLADLWTIVSTAAHSLPSLTGCTL